MCTSSTRSYHISRSQHTTITGCPWGVEPHSPKVSSVHYHFGQILPIVYCHNLFTHWVASLRLSPPIFYNPWIGSPISAWAPPRHPFRCLSQWLAWSSHLSNHLTVGLAPSRINLALSLPVAKHCVCVTETQQPTISA